MSDSPSAIPRHGRGSALNPANRFEKEHIELDPGALSDAERRSVDTRFLVDASRSALAGNDSPDVGFDFGLNPYRGCEHGCAYCFARPSHEYLGFSAGLDFETRILVKPELPRLLAETFERPSWRPQVVALSGNTDPYQPAERKLGLTRRCLEVFADYRNPVSIITKNHLVTRDLDLLCTLAKERLVRVTLSITSLRDDLIGAMEPRTSRPARRLDAVRALAEAGVPVGINIAPVIPGLTDEEMPSIIEAAAGAGAGHAAYLLLRLPGAVEPIFLEWLHRTHPQRAEKVLARLRSLHGGRLSDSRFGKRSRGEGPWAAIFRSLFAVSARKFGLDAPPAALATDRFRRRQGELF